MSTFHMARALLTETLLNSKKKPGEREREREREWEGE
jgi:hypothetical protein